MAASVESEVIGDVASSANMHSKIGAAVTAETKVEIGVEVKVEGKGTVKRVCSAAEVEITEGRSSVERIEVTPISACTQHMHIQTNSFVGSCDESAQLHFILYLSKHSKQGLVA